MLKRILPFFIFFGIGLLTNAQEQPKEGERWVTATVNKGDTIPMVYLGISQVFGEKVFRSKSDQRKYNRLKRNVKKVYPYAKLAGALLAHYSDSIAQAETDRQKKKFYKQVEQDLRAEYEGELKKLTVTQGKLLIKLIDRETGNTSYEIVKELRNSVTAFFWQSLAKLFGNDLKSNYDPSGVDRDIESIVLALESGQG